LSRVRCITKPKFDQIYQGNVIEVKPEPKNNPTKCQIYVEFSQESFRDIEASLKNANSAFKIEEDKLGFFQQMRDNLEKLSESPAHEEIFVKKAEPEKTQGMDYQTKILYTQYVENNTDLNNDQKLAIKNVKIISIVS